MYANPFQLSLDTVLGASRLLGHRLEDRAGVRDAQDRALVQSVQACSTVALTHRGQEAAFAVAPLDVLVCEHGGRKLFHIIEMNGTGIGGLTNLSEDAVGAALEAVGEMALHVPGRAPVVLVAVSGKESEQSPRLNKLAYEKVLYAEALKRAFDGDGRPAAVTTLAAAADDPDGFHNGQPTVVLGYIKEFLRCLRCERDGRLTLFGREVGGLVNDRFILNVVQQFDGRLDLRRVATMNRCFLAGADKGVAYELLNDCLARHRGRHLPRRVEYARVEDRETLIQTVLAWVRRGVKTVIKPQGTGLGHGIEFFLSADESADAVTARIDASLKLTEQYYRIRGGALPYTVCEFFDTCTIGEPSHPLYGHKYELRVVVYRDGLTLRAFPSIVKVSSQPYDPARQDRDSLINNITASAEMTKAAGTEFMLPLANRETLALLDLRQDHLIELCAFATRYVRHTLDRLHDEPEFFGLPAAGWRLGASAKRQARFLVKTTA